MKTNYFNKLSHFYFAFVFALISGSISITGCSSDASRNNDILTENRAAITFSIGGINETTTISAPENLSASASRTLLALQHKISNLGNNVDAITNAEKVPIGNSLSPAYTAIASTKMNTYAATSPMKKDNTFRVLVYNSNNQYVGAIDQAAGATFVKLDLVKGGNYKWYAYSYNDTSALPDISAINTANPQVEARNKDLLYASGELINAQVGDNHQKIIFEHVMAKITVIIDANSVPANINAVNDITFNTNLTQAIFNLKDSPGFVSQGTLSAPYIYTLKEVTTGNSTIKMAEFYTVPLPDINSFIIKTGTMNIQDFSLPSANVTPNNSYSFTFPNKVSPTAGTNTNLTITLQKGALIGGNFWAVGNLYYDWTATDPKFQYKIRPDSNNRNSGNDVPNKNMPYSSTDYWAYGAITPDANSLTSTAVNGDLCSLVYPQNTWRMPNNADYEALGDTKVNSLSNDGTNAQRNRGTIVTNMATGKQIRFPNDYRNVDELILFSSFGYYWQSDIWLGSQRKFVTIPVAPPLISPGQTGSNVSYRLSIRCIRSK
ncbi:hypothetical protein [Elizabethkingia meningoseptica]|uniref:hypothetical protein n=1 Tax=Elizabethkingia meningoseptica TaxID=238 RepID=UPI000935A029|nr:hypothetical protein [Elizabethkingia meningoseptica]